MTDRGSFPTRPPDPFWPHEEGDTDVALTALQDSALAYEAACEILEQIDLMMALADLGGVVPASLTLLRRARAEAERVVADAVQATRPH